MQRLALMMAVMILGMPPVNGYHTGVGPGEQGTRNLAESMFPPSAWFYNSGGTLATEKEVSPGAPNGGPPVEPGGFSVQRILQQVQRGMEGLSKIKEEVQRVGQEAMRRNPGGKEWNPGSGESGQEDNGRLEEGSGRDPRQRPKKRSDVPENGRPQLVKNKQREEHGTARLLMQFSGGVCREGYFLLPYNE
jgi:hypothetical protein